ncbi:stage III sporulation protein AE [Halothermothrix orenii]|uniref:Sporulation stage III protein AE n=1 Tax=Halothermothrix orenii (strain H 168 / OCM 544 / DSM 9562) TaxID=373903 RepID=B8D2F1_HALOH|nr:stage III sporulation protein AE [Halothermothrix orenii]ACL69378.1 Sporulation stage III protein AE [Halothermothrix orenii H 168]
MKRLISIIILINIILMMTIPVLAEETPLKEAPLNKEDIILNQIEKINLNQLQKEVDKINKNMEGYMPHLNIKELILGFMKGDLDVSWAQIGGALLKYLGKEVTANFKILGQIIILAVMAAILNVFHNSFTSETISKTASMLIFMVLAILSLNGFKIAVEIGITTIDTMVSFMQALIPVLLTLLVSIGAMTSAAVFHPITFMVISFLSSLIRTIIFPMIFISAILNIVNNITSEFKISRLSGLFKEFSMGMLGLSLILFTGIMVIQGGAAAVTDSLSLRTAKYLTGTFIPIIGGIFSDAVDLIVSCSLIIKNAINLFGMIVIVFMISYPLIKIIALIIIYKIAGAIIQPISDGRLVNILDNLGNTLVLIFLAVSGVSLMFFIVLTILVGSANLTVMMR